MRLVEAIPCPSWPELDDSLMSNCDHEVNKAVAEKLKSGEFVAPYPAWDFHAMCWFDDGKYHAAIRRYHALVATFACETPQELMKEVSNEFGWE